MSAEILPFALANRWIVTAEPERRFVRKRHRTEWWTVCRRKGEEDMRYRCASRADALWLADEMRKHFAHMAFCEWVQARLDRLPPIQRARAIERLKAIAAQDALA